jgi:hypothetical protein
VTTQIAWILKQLLLPSFFVLLGATVGFFAGQLKEHFEARRVKQSFLKAVCYELGTLRVHLEGTFTEIDEVLNDLSQHGKRKAIHLSTQFQIGVYTSQLSRLRDVSDPIILDIIKFYDQLSNLEIIKDHVTSRSFELVMLTEQPNDIGKEGPLGADYLSSLEEVRRRLGDLISSVGGLIRRLPQ